MGKSYKIRLNSSLTLDGDKEKDLIAKLEELKDSHRLGEFLGLCLRASMDNPGILQRCASSVAQYGVSEDRKVFYDGIKNKINEMMKKIDSIYDLVLKLYTLVQFRKQYGLEDRTKNMARAQFILQKQIDELCEVLGVSNLSHLWESDRLSILDKKAEEVLEYIISAHGDVVDELVNDEKEALRRVRGATQDRLAKEDIGGTVPVGYVAVNPYMMPYMPGMMPPNGYGVPQVMPGTMQPGYGVPQTAMQGAQYMQGNQGVDMQYQGSNMNNTSIKREDMGVRIDSVQSVRKDDNVNEVKYNNYVNREDSKGNIESKLATGNVYSDKSIERTFNADKREVDSRVVNSEQTLGNTTNTIADKEVLDNNKDDGDWNALDNFLGI